MVQVVAAKTNRGVYDKTWRSRFQQLSLIDKARVPVLASFELYQQYVYENPVREKEVMM